MLELVGMFAVATGVLTVAAVGWMRWSARNAPPTAPTRSYGGVWRVVEETVPSGTGSVTRVAMVRFDAGHETGRVNVCDIADDDPDWPGKMTEARYEADRRIQVLRDTEG